MEGPAQHSPDGPRHWALGVGTAALRASQPWVSGKQRRLGQLKTRGGAGPRITPQPGKPPWSTLQRPSPRIGLVRHIHGLSGADITKRAMPRAWPTRAAKPATTPTVKAAQSEGERGNMIARSRLNLLNERVQGGTKFCASCSSGWWGEMAYSKWQLTNARTPVSRVGWLCRQSQGGRLESGWLLAEQEQDLHPELPQAGWRAGQGDAVG